jgi:hypothetical protein
MRIFGAFGRYKDRASQVFVEVSAANAAISHLESDFITTTCTGPKSVAKSNLVSVIRPAWKILRYRYRVQADVTFRMETDGLHCCHLCDRYTIWSKATSALSVLQEVASKGKRMVDDRVLSSRGTAIGFAMQEARQHCRPCVLHL